MKKKWLIAGIVLLAVVGGLVTFAMIKKNKALEITYREVPAVRND